MKLCPLGYSLSGQDSFCPAGTVAVPWIRSVGARPRAPTIDQNRRGRRPAGGTEQAEQAEHCLCNRPPSAPRARGAEANMPPRWWSWRIRTGQAGGRPSGRPPRAGGQKGARSARALFDNRGRTIRTAGPRYPRGRHRYLRWRSRSGSAARRSVGTRPPGVACRSAGATASSAIAARSPPPRGRLRARGQARPAWWGPACGGTTRKRAVRSAQTPWGVEHGGSCIALVFCEAAAASPLLRGARRNWGEAKPPRHFAGGQAWGGSSPDIWMAVSVLPCCAEGLLFAVEADRAPPPSIFMGGVRNLGGSGSLPVGRGEWSLVSWQLAIGS